MIFRFGILFVNFFINLYKKVNILWFIWKHGFKFYKFCHLAMFYPVGIIQPFSSLFWCFWSPNYDEFWLFLVSLPYVTRICFLNWLIFLKNCNNHSILLDRHEAKDRRFYSVTFVRHSRVVHHGHSDYKLKIELPETMFKMLIRAKIWAKNCFL